MREDKYEFGKMTPENESDNGVVQRIPKNRSFNDM